MSTNASFSDGSQDPPPGDGDRPYSWIDEWLCEYVDGTMDPALEAVFTSYVEANPELKSHIEDLQQTRNLLSQCQFPNDAAATKQAQTDVCDHVESDLLCSQLSLREALLQRPQFSAGLVASVLTALMIGVLVGATVVDAPVTLGSKTAGAETVEHVQVTNRPAVTVSPLPLGAQHERRAARPVAASRAWSTPTLDSLHVPPAALDLMRPPR